VNEQGTLTSWRAQTEGQVRIIKESVLGHSLPRVQRGRDKSGECNKVSE